MRCCHEKDGFIMQTARDRYLRFVNDDARMRLSRGAVFTLKLFRMTDTPSRETRTAGAVAGAWGIVPEQRRVRVLSGAVPHPRPSGLGRHCCGMFSARNGGVGMSRCPPVLSPTGRHASVPRRRCGLWEVRLSARVRLSAASAFTETPSDHVRSSGCRVRSAAVLKSVPRHIGQHDPRSWAV